MFVIQPKIPMSRLSLLGACPIAQLSSLIHFPARLQPSSPIYRSTIDVTKLTNPHRAPIHQEDSTCVRHSSFLSRFFPFVPLIQNLFGFVFCWVFSRYHWSEFAYITYGLVARWLHPRIGTEQPGGFSGVSLPAASPSVIEEERGGARAAKIGRQKSDAQKSK